MAAEVVATACSRMLWIDSLWDASAVLTVIVSSTLADETLTVTNEVSNEAWMATAEATEASVALS